ncbi:hypothetical protein C8E02_0534 [Vogesella indigofera]|uniref:Uncharacterized protein n=1 Tax=Vogesella indigofera TaxID=45465 RepID=A0A495BIR9_VOGIN|nr:hypothetical protein C8E02_0534 [Vogesella indigofera]
MISNYSYLAGNRSARLCENIFVSLMFLMAYRGLHNQTA